MGQPANYVHNISGDLEDEDVNNDWREKSRKLQARRWRKIMRAT